MTSAMRALCVLLCLRPGTAVQSSSARAQHQPRELLAASDAFWGEVVPEEVPHAVVEELELFEKVSTAVKAKVKEARPASVGLLEKPASKRPEVALYWRTRSLENGTKGSMKMNSGCNATADGGTTCNVSLQDESAGEHKIHLRLRTAKSLREGDKLITNVQVQLATGDKQELKFTCPACSFPCRIPLPGTQMQVQMPPCPILAGVYDLSMPLGVVPFMDTVRAMTANTYALHA
eukprot:CAMPEP_0168406836 /NCGR_PEP_ID=MMETSP0228-20121227/25857_1 /TAXON_ID=133427 /ORGANISM="Protoceratium reticulatum, Strain CCCM 535 (=CCMP 1889)" /LENGTH=233 /DNA_ID=CAMNT_0008420497 /DNA_START=47 /DNA_END=744 /DNA_ORIENTATION=+